LDPKYSAPGRDIQSAIGKNGGGFGLREPDAIRSPNGEYWMPMDAREIESMIKAAIPDAEVTIRDLAGDGDHYAATVISASFKGKSRVQQHQIVYQSLKGQMGGVLHALALQTGIPEG
jgi:stress-induced morphogen